jgi:hypothetical protein
MMRNMLGIQGVLSESVENAFTEVIMKMIQFVPELRILELLRTAGRGYLILFRISIR